VTTVRRARPGTLARGDQLVQNMVMSKVNIFEVKAKLSEYLERAAGGERIVICRHNKPVAELRPVDETRTVDRPIGPLPGRPTFEVPPSFFEPMTDEELDAWEGGGSVPSPPAARPRSSSKASETGAAYTAKRGRRSARPRS
jgi:prevent-host-death family protein